MALLVTVILVIGAAFTVAGLWLVVSRSRRSIGVVGRRSGRTPMRRELRGIACIGVGVLLVAAAMIAGVSPQLVATDPFSEGGPDEISTGDQAAELGSELGSGPAQEGVDILDPDAALEQVEPPPDVVEMMPEDLFLALIRDDLPATTTIADASDGSLLEAGEEACTQILAGAAVNDIVLFDGNLADSLLVANAAVRSLCG